MQYVSVQLGCLIENVSQGLGAMGLQGAQERKQWNHDQTA